MIRQPIITVLGHVDHGKTSILDAIRNTRVVAKEPGAITQHIGATEVPLEVIQKISGNIIKKFGFELKIPGLLLIDTPGHEAFTNLRKRGGSIADLAILVVDAMQGIEPQTIEAIEILKLYKVPFVVAMNKIDMLPFYSSKEGSYLENLATHDAKVKAQMDEKLYIFVGELYKHGFEGERFDRCAFGKQIPIVPCSAKTREGLPELITLLAGLSQKYLEKELEINHEEAGKGAVLEAKEEKGLGKTIDVILYEGSISVNDEIVVVGKNGVIKTKVRALLQPKPLQEMKNTKEKFTPVKQIFAAAGLKISAPGLEDALVGSTMLVVKNGNEIEQLQEEFKETKFESNTSGVIVKTDAIGSMEALVELLKKENIVVRKAEIGKITRKDVMEAASMLESEPLQACVLGFNVDVDEEAGKEADFRNVKIFNEKVIYSLIDFYKKYCTDVTKAEKEKELACLVWPVEFELIRGKVFRNNKPAIVGAKVNEGKLKEGWKVMNKNGEVIGKISGIQNNGKTLKELKKGEEAAIAIDGATIGRNLFEGEVLYSCIPIHQYGDIQKFIKEFNSDELELIEKIKEKQKNTKSEEIE